MKEKIKIFLNKVKLKIMISNLDKYEKKYSDNTDFEEKYIVMSKEEFQLIKKLGSNLESHITQIKLNNQEIKKLKEINNGMILMINAVLEQSKEKEQARKKAVGKVGGLTASLNKEKEKTEHLLEDKANLENTIKDLKTKLEESMSDKYLVRKIPSGRKPKSQTMKTKNCSVPSTIARNMFERNK